jgi:hypothetical protein
MALRIDPSHNRFRDIVRGKIKQNLRKYISNGEWLGRQGKDVVSIPVPQIEMPRFHFGERGQGGVGQGPGKVGDSLGSDQPGEDGRGKAGSEAGEHILEVEVSMESWRRSSAKDSNCRASSPGARNVSSRSGIATSASAASARNRCATSSARSARPSNAKS